MKLLGGGGGREDDVEIGGGGGGSVGPPAGLTGGEGGNRGFELYFMLKCGLEDDDGFEWVLGLVRRAGDVESGI